MQIKPAKIAQFLQSPSCGIVLVYGPDTGRVSEICSALCSGAAVTEFDAKDVSDDAGRVIEAASSISMFDPVSAVRIRNAGDKLSKAAKAVFDAQPANRVVIDAGELPARSSLRKLFEGESKAAAIACYAPDANDLSALVSQILGAAGRAVDRDALMWLGENLPKDGMAARREIEKLDTYLGDARRCTLADAQACVGDSVEEDIDAAVMAVGEGNIGAWFVTQKRLEEAETASVLLLRSFQAHFRKLLQGRILVDGGASPSDAVQALRPPVFFKNKSAMERQVARWECPKIERALGKLTEAERQTKMTGYPADLVVAQCLFEIAVAARQASRSGGRQ